MGFRRYQSTAPPGPARPAPGLPGRLLACQRGQTTVEYMLLVAILVVAMAFSLEVLFGALQSLFKQLGGELAKPYP